MGVAYTLWIAETLLRRQVGERYPADRVKAMRQGELSLMDRDDLFAFSQREQAAASG